MDKVVGKIRSLFDNGFEVNQKVKTFALLISLLIFVGGLVLSVTHNPSLFKNISWPFLGLMLLIGVPVTVVINAVRYILTGRVLSQRISIINSLNITVLSTAANALPLPAGVLVRIAGLKTKTTSYKDSASATFLVFGVWAGATCLYSATALCVLSSSLTIPAIAIYILGTIILAISSNVLLKKMSSTQLLVLILANEFAAAASDAFRLWLCFIALGASTSFVVTSILAISAVAGSAVGIVPAGLGLREAVTALIGPLINVSASAGFVVAALNRCLGLVGIMPLVAILLMKNWLRRTD